MSHPSAKVRLITEKGRSGFECLVCRRRAFAETKKDAIAARKAHVQTAEHRSSLRAARRE
jgi:hypothetical protein